MENHRSDRHRQTILLRGMLIVAVGGLLIDSGFEAASAASLALVLIFALSNVVLPFVPRRHVQSSRFELLVGAGDLVLVGFGIQLAGAIGGALPISCLLMTLVMALGHHRLGAVAGAATVGALHAWLLLRTGPGTGPGIGIGRQLVLQMLFLCSVGLYYGFMTERSHGHRKQTADAGHRRDRELSTILEILDTTTGPHDLRQIALQIVSKLTEIVPAVRCSIVHIDAAMEKAHVLVSHDDPQLDMLEIDLEKYPEIREAIRTRTPVIVQDILHNPMMAEVRDRLRALDFQSLIVIPLIFGNDLLGTLCVKAARLNQAFTPPEIDFCKAVARTSSHVMKNALLHRQLREETDRHRATGDKLAAILDQSPDPIFTTDQEGRIVEFNRGAETLLGYRKDEVRGRPSHCLFVNSAGPATRPEGPANEAIAGIPTRFRARNGTEVETELSCGEVRNEANVVTGSVWVGRDITELKAAHMQLMQAEKLSTIGEVISGVAHELNNPLCGVLGFSQLLMARHSNSPQSNELEKIHDSALRCQKIVRNLLAFARRHTPERKFLGVNGIIEKTLDLKRYQLHVNDINVERDLEHELPRTMLDFHQMQQVFLNLINNAQHAMTMNRDRPGKLMVRTRRVEDRIRVEFTDNGGGMSPDVLRRVFDPFFTTKEQGQGTGLGLSVSYGIVKEHGGRIDARSRPGEGATFAVELPIVPDVEPDQEGESGVRSIRAVARPAGKRRILVVDDEALVVDLLISILQGIGHRVDTAADGVEAFGKICTQTYDLIITDIRMPQMNGMELYRKILARQPGLISRVVFITGDLIDPETTRFLDELGARPISKPLDVNEVIEAVQQALDRIEDSSAVA